MASMKILVTLAIVSLVFPATMAKEFVVGDEKGWTINFDYQAWAEGKDFHVGDKLIFKYTEGAHNVHRVDGTAFEMCVAPAASEALKTGNDVITLTATGKKWYICGVGKHCEVGKQKLQITVFPPSEAPASSPSAGSTPDSAASHITASTFYMWIVAAFGIFMTVLF